jgi:GDPmannose 4,6-dehydratase
VILQKPNGPILGWKPKYDLPALVKEMVESDLNLFGKQLFIQQSGL